MDRTFDNSGGRLIVFDNFREEAQAFFKKMYPEIEYLPDSDSFKYRGYEFDYFICGIGIDNHEKSYMLVDKEPCIIGPYYVGKTWLFQHGDKEERWKEFLQAKLENVERNKKKESLVLRFWDWVCNLVEGSNRGS